MTGCVRIRSVRSETLPRAASHPGGSRRHFIRDGARPGGEHTMRRSGPRQIAGAEVVGSSAAGGAAKRMAQRVDALGLCRHHRHHRNAEPRAERCGVDGDPAPRGHVRHVQAHDEPGLNGQQLPHQRQVAGQICGIHDDDHQVAAPPDLIHCVADDGGFGAVEGHVVQARHVEHVHADFGELQRPDAKRGRRAGEIRGLCPGAAEQIEEGGLAGVGIADEYRLHAATGRQHRRRWINRNGERGLGHPSLTCRCRPVRDDVDLRRDRA